MQLDKISPKFSKKSLILAAITIFISCNSWAALSQSIPRLTEDERSLLRYRLENLYNEFDLLIRNKRVDQLDIKKQERQSAALKVSDRIPFSPDLSGLKKNLTESANDSGLKLIQLNISNPPVERTPNKNKMPKKVPVFGGDFRPDPGKIVREIHFHGVVGGSYSEVSRWIDSWKENQMRLVELDSPENESFINLNSAEPLKWKIKGHAFQFKKVQFPQLIPTRPRDLLPQWAKENPKLFSKLEPVLWSFVVRAEQLLPETPPLYEIRGRFLLNAARMDFFLSKALRRPKNQQVRN